MDYKDFFTFTQQERRGIAVFFLTATTIILAAEYWPKGSQNMEEDLSMYYFPSDSLQQDDSAALSIENDIFGGSSEPEKKVFQKFSFDPNHLSVDSLLLLGFSKFGAKSLTNYVGKGGKIKDAAKFKTIFGIDTNLVNQLQAFIVYPTPESASVYKNEKKEKTIYIEKVQEIVDINSADSLQLDAIKGVGPYMTKRILSYRKKLGGYLYKAQLLELNIIADSLYQPIEKYLTVNPELIRKININTADYKTFVTNPYFDKETANVILKYRKQHGPFKDIAHISRIRSLSESTGNKILPYLSVE